MIQVMSYIRPPIPHTLQIICDDQTNTASNLGEGGGLGEREKSLKLGFSVEECFCFIDKLLLKGEALLVLILLSCACPTATSLLRELNQQQLYKKMQS